MQTDRCRETETDGDRRIQTDADTDTDRQRQTDKDRRRETDRSLTLEANIEESLGKISQLWQFLQYSLARKLFECPK